MMYLLAVILFLWVFWYAYILVMGLYRAHLAGRMTRFTYFLSFPALLAGYVMDVVAQYTLATVFFLDLPKRGEHLVTDRLKRYIAQGSGWRAAKAEWVCTHLLDIFDPTGNHC
ncbi:hypothetical protein GCM10027292_17590 [Hydrogenophaga aquatica]